MNTAINKLLILLPYLAVIFILVACSSKLPDTGSAGNETTNKEPLRVAIAPYQELALLVNEKNLGLEKKYGTEITILTMPWEEMLTAVGSAGQTVDVGFVGLADYLAKTKNLNRPGSDRILYLYPGWTFHGGGFITFNSKVPELTTETVKDKNLVKKFLSFKLGAQKNSCNHMLLWVLAHNAGMKLADLSITDTTLNDGFLAAENGSVDAAAAGLTQRTEALKRHGRVAVSMDTVGLAEPSGFICKESTYKKRKKDIDALIKMWFDCANYVLSDLDHHSATTLAYLKANSSTQYTLDEFKRALSQEYIPRSVNEAEKEIVSGDGKYSISRAVAVISPYLIDVGATKSASLMPKIVTIQ